MREVRQHRLRKINHPNILFIIYVICFLFSSGIFIYQLSAESVTRQQHDVVTTRF